MDIRIFFASFALIFIAELGDKTQLTALALASSSRSPWAVFLGTSTALVLGSALAIIFGELLTRFLPVKVLHISSAILFILMGVILLVNIARRADYDNLEEETEARKAAAQIGGESAEAPGLMFRLIVNQAMAFEESIIEYLESLSRELPAGEERQTLEELISADRRHAQSILEMAEPGNTDNEQSAAEQLPLTDDAIKLVQKTAPPPEAPRLQDYPLNREQPVNIERPEVNRIIEAAITAEEDIAQFYLALSRLTHMPKARRAFQHLAAEDMDHARRLYGLISQSD